MYVKKSVVNLFTYIYTHTHTHTHTHTQDNRGLTQRMSKILKRYIAVVVVLSLLLLISYTTINAQGLLTIILLTCLFFMTRAVATLWLFALTMPMYEDSGLA